MSLKYQFIFEVQIKGAGQRNGLPPMLLSLIAIGTEGEPNGVLGPMM